ncbi:MAG: hypothetical protein JO303_12110, partial [Caulobacteraceae bacterium]|nr:hypothetical protein [Caulobacteraceae bacterium]
MNASISMNAAGTYVYNFNNNYDILVDLGNASGIIVDDTASGGDDQFLLNQSSGNVINSGSGNDTFVVLSTSSDLGGNVLHGGTGFNVVQLNGSNTNVDLTGDGVATAIDTGIDAVIGRTGLTGETVEVSLAQIASSSIYNGGVPGNAFIALIGATGAVNVKETPGFSLVGEVDAAGNDYDASGDVLTGSAAASLSAEVTSIGSVLGTAAIDYSGVYVKNAGPSAAAAAYAAGALSAYVFSNGSTSYTVWTDGTVTPTSATGAVLSTAYQPAPATPAVSPTLGAVTQFNKQGAWSSANLGVNPAGETSLVLADGTAIGYAAILVNGVSGTVIHGDSGKNGGDWFGLGKSGGGNTVTGSPAGDIFDLQNSTSLVDILNGAGGFNVVRASENGA